MHIKTSRWVSGRAGDALHRCSNVPSRQLSSLLTTPPAPPRARPARCCPTGPRPRRACAPASPDRARRRRPRDGIALPSDSRRTLPMTATTTAAPTSSVTTTSSPPPPPSSRCRCSTSATSPPRRATEPRSWIGCAPRPTTSASSTSPGTASRTEVQDDLLGRTRTFFALPGGRPARDLEPELRAVPRLDERCDRAHRRRRGPARADRHRPRARRRRPRARRTRPTCGSSGRTSGPPRCRSCAPSCCAGCARPSGSRARCSGCWPRRSVRMPGGSTAGSTTRP